MPIRFPEPPAEVAQAAQPARPPRWKRLLRADYADPEMGGGMAVPPQPVFTAGLEQLLSAQEAEETVEGGPTWRFSRFDANGELGAFEVNPESRGGSSVAGGDDRFSAAIRDALAVAADDERVRGGDYEARLFRVPALYLLALWLHAAQQPDLFVPLHAVAGVETRTVYDQDSFLAALRDAAEGALSAYRDAERPDELGS
ncbi:MAG TPA: hypothetical protein VHF51_12755 [Solirubrobacteraceae bacterium]|nr:hypothetical protein [Solirubrobacteraceae bacterium]